MRNICRTHSGKFFHIDQFSDSNIDLENIYYGLVGCWRWAGQTEPRYSVLEHSITVCQLIEYLDVPLSVSREVFLRAAALHDASEAYLNDLPSPIKQRCGSYSYLEDRFQEQINKRFRCHLLNQSDVCSLSFVDRLSSALEYLELFGIENTDPLWNEYSLDIRVLASQLHREDVRIYRTQPGIKETWLSYIGEVT